MCSIVSCSRFHWISCKLLTFGAWYFKIRRENISKCNVKRKLAQSRNSVFWKDGVIGSWHCRNECTYVRIIEKAEFTGFVISKTRWKYVTKWIQMACRTCFHWLHTCHQSFPSHFTQFVNLRAYKQQGSIFLNGELKFKGSFTQGQMALVLFGCHQVRNSATVTAANNKNCTR